jgi:ribosome-associated protein
LNAHLFRGILMHVVHAATPWETCKLVQPLAREAASPQLPEIPAATQSPAADLLALVRHALDDMKAEDVCEIDLAGKTSLADAMVVASGRSQRHVGSIADNLVKALKEAGHPTPRIEGMPHNDWVLVDAGDIIVHVFRPEVRAFYNLEKMWSAERPRETRG